MSGFLWRRGLPILMVFAGLAMTPSASTAQGPEGPGVEVTVDKLLFMPEVYDSKFVRTSGELDVIPSRRGHQYAFRGAYGLRLLLVPWPAIAQDWERQALSWVGREVVVMGRFLQVRPGTRADAPPTLTDPATGGAPLYLEIRTFEGPADEKAETRTRRATGEVTLQELEAGPEAFIGRDVIVTGQFRGDNLFGDLPPASRKSPLDWVLKDGSSSAWVTGKKAEGRGWRLDPTSRSDSAKWLQVRGRVSLSGEVVVIRAASVVLANRPSAGSDAGR